MVYKILRNSFWEEIGKEYSIFSQYCNHYDWNVIIEHIAEQINNIKQNEPTSILDVGCGWGNNIKTIMDLLLIKTHIRNKLDVVEPSKAMKKLIAMLLKRYNEGGYLDLFYEELQFIKKQYDCILFMHSSYYIENFFEILKWLFQEKLKKMGKIIILSLPSDSDFFLGENELILPNTSDKISTVLQKNKIYFDKTRFNSRFTQPEMSDEIVLKTLYKFITMNNVPYQNFIEFLNTNKIVDFKDEIITITKN